MASSFNMEDRLLSIERRLKVLEEYLAAWSTEAQIAFLEIEVLKDQSRKIEGGGAALMGVQEKHNNRSTQAEDTAGYEAAGSKPMYEKLGRLFRKITKR